MTIMQTHDEIWWLKPHAVFPFLVAASALGAFLLPESVYLEHWRTAKFVGSREFISCLLVAFSFWIGAMFCRFARPIGPGPEQPLTSYRSAVLRTIFLISVALTLGGYMVWGAAAKSRGADLSLVTRMLSSEKGAQSEMKEQHLVTISGVTTLTQFGMAAIILGCLIGLTEGWKRVRWPLAAILLLTLARAFLNSERLALIEVLVPALVLIVSIRYSAKWRYIGFCRSLLSLIPIAAPFFIFALFVFFEYFRSWSNWYADGNKSLLEFGAIHLGGYYATALNNSSFLFQRLDMPSPAPYNIFTFAWKLPVIGPFLEEHYGKVFVPTPEYFDLLSSGANPEFNNPGGALFPVMDLGLLGGCLYWAIAGAICFTLYRGFITRRPFGLLMYPLAYLALLESPRILYWAEGRSFPSFLLLFLVAAAISFGLSRVAVSRKAIFLQEANPCLPLL